MSEPAKIVWWRDGKEMSPDDPRLAWTRPAEPETDPDPDPAAPAAAILPERVEFGEILRAVAEQYETGEIDVVICSYTDSDGFPVPMLAPYPMHSSVDAIALADMTHNMIRHVAEQRLIDARKVQQIPTK